MKTQHVPPLVAHNEPLVAIPPLPPRWLQKIPLMNLSALSPVRRSGFTLVEMMVTMAIIGTLVAIGVPQFRQFIGQRAMSSQISEFSSSVRLARSEAIKRRREVTMCRTTDPNAAAPACATTAGDWSTGWIVFEDGVNRGQVDQGDTIISVHTPAAGRVQITSGANFTVTFRGTGLAVPGNNRTVRFTLENSTAACGTGFREVRIATTGRTALIPCPA